MAAIALEILPQVVSLNKSVPVSILGSLNCLVVDGVNIIALEVLQEIEVGADS